MLKFNGRLLFTLRPGKLLLRRTYFKFTVSTSKPKNGCYKLDCIEVSKSSLCQLRFYAKGHRKNRILNSGAPKKIEFEIPNYISVNKLANLLNCRIQTLLKDLKRLGFADISNEYILSREYVELILQEYNYNLPEINTAVTSKTLYDELKQPSNPKLLKKRPPVVTIMGHVDHGKTTIIDYLKKSSIVLQEHGGITQHIGAFQVVTPVSKKKITFLDTPGHAAFLKMRERGANITDIIVLVVALDDSIMPQTLEAIKHIKKSGNELIVAITKIDKFPRLEERNKRIEKVTNDLMAQGIMVEKMGGDVQVIPISAKSGENMENLEESIILLSDIMDIRSEISPKTMSLGWIIESKVQSTVGNVATVLVKKGTVRKAEILLSGNTYCRVKTILGDTKKPVNEALPSQAVEVSGWKNLPSVGDEFLQVKNESIAKKYIDKRGALEEVERNAKNVEQLNEMKTLEIKKKEEHADVEEAEPEAVTNTTPKSVNFIIKSDVSGSAEAVRESIENLGNGEVQCKVISSSVGIPTESDLKMAQITNSIIVCFNLASLPNDIINNKQHVEIRRYDVIYKLIEDVITVLESNMEPYYEKKIMATVDLKEVFEYKNKKKMIKIAGCKVANGEITRNSTLQVLRKPNNTVVFDGKVSTLKHGKDDISVAKKGQECGITFANGFEDFKKGDKISVYESVEIPRHL
ncbi:translation initiation factor 2 KNAG_0I01620 [Huiozyma naganishii CBS 8797]|uniref:Translation initiation factor IF-2, mitochondrial n=1 Tax=Huiozyma naganishii (strain ATCC MYA-139 / BCRC 22969 / CBS 8797 / KCTC 17520 / NBRC 10181 / NCYC 3082 / Yp74L-3) TaxID=1071383 RepID=J7RQ92_HUIN7|nr:hypothetical protein KNAG_0I01620 [Kazachstania naganishii CBS 8797]CCK71948.1 hypothetical protein KNAG_0I01620 [Kazachstania naganishii CBS 8797]